MEAKSLPLPDPENVRQRLAEAETEVKALRRLLRMSAAAQRADEARQKREALTNRNGNTR
jgi:hypothetical protein